MSKGNTSVLGFLQKLGKALMTPIAALPAAGLLLRLGQPDVLDISWMAAAGDAIMGNMAILFAIGIAVGLAEENNGVAGLAGAIGYFVLTKVAFAFAGELNPGIADGSIKFDMGVLAGFATGIIGGLLYNKFKDIKVPQFLGFFGGKRFVPIITSLVCLILGVVMGWIWPSIQDGINNFGNTMANSGPIGAFGFGFLNRLLIPIGLHHVLNTIFWFQFGTFTAPSGEVFNGDIFRFLNGDPTAGAFQTGFFPIMMFALPAACFAMIAAAKKEKRKAVTGMLAGIAFTSFLTGVTEPIEFTFMFLAPVLYGAHALLTGVSLALTNFLGMRDGFSFSAGFIDYVLNFNIAENPIGLVFVGLAFAAIYFVIFYAVIKKFDLKTPGREDDEIDVIDSRDMKGKKSDLDVTAKGIIEAIGGKENIKSLDACVTRIRLTLADSKKIDESKLKKLGATGVMKLSGNNVQVVVGTIADPLVSRMKKQL